MVVTEKVSHISEYIFNIFYYIVTLIVYNVVILLFIDSLKIVKTGQKVRKRQGNHDYYNENKQILEYMSFKIIESNRYVIEIRV